MLGSSGKTLRKVISRVPAQVRPKTTQPSRQSTITAPQTSNNSSSLTSKSKTKDNLPTANMPSYIVTLKDDATDEQIAAAKKQVEEQGGKIGHEYGIIKGFQAIFPEGSVHSLDSNEHVKAVEADGEVKIQ